MSYDMGFEIDGAVVRLPEKHNLRGGTYAVGGEPDAVLNITYNYSKHFVRVFGEGGIRWLYGKTAAEVRQILAPAIATLGTERSDDYWEPTPGNAGAALADLLTLAQMVPDGAVLRGD